MVNRHNTNHDRAVEQYLCLIASGQKVSQKKFCEQRAISLSSFEKALRRHRKKPVQNEPSHPKRKGLINYHSLKIEFFNGDWDTLAGFARDKGLKVTTGFRKRTRGWVDEKKEIRDLAIGIAKDQLVDERAGSIISGTHEELRKIYLDMLQGIKTMGEGLSELTKEEVSNAEEIYFTARGIKALCEAAEKIEPRINALNSISEFNQVIDDLESGTITIDVAVLRMVRMGMRVPRALEIMLSKPIEEIPPDDAEIISVEKIMEERKLITHQIQQQRDEFVPQRTEEVRKLKEELADKDSFAAQKMETGNEPE